MPLVSFRSVSGYTVSSSLVCNARYDGKDRQHDVSDDGVTVVSI